MDSLLMHAFAPITHVSSFLFWDFFVFPFFFISLFTLLSFLFVFLSFCLLFSLSFFTMHTYGLLYSLLWQDLPFLPINHFWPIVDVLPRLPTGLPLPLHCVGCTTPHSWTKRFWFCLLPLLILPSGQGLNLSFTNFYRMHLVISTHVCFFWVRCHVSRTFLSKRTWARTPK